jgi:predicted DNA-binding protein (MmcQ/YjbR family)
LISAEQFRKLALSLTDAEEEGHFDKISFRVRKKIFATFDAKASRACLKLTVKDQQSFISTDQSIVYPVPNKWGQQGWTFVELQKVNRDLIKELLRVAYETVARK